MYGKTFGPVRFYWTAKRKNFPIRPRHARDDKCDTVFIFFLNTFREKGPENSKYCNVVPRNVRAAGSLRFSFPSRRAFDFFFFFFDYLKDKKNETIVATSLDGPRTRHSYWFCNWSLNWGKKREKRIFRESNQSAVCRTAESWTTIDHRWLFNKQFFYGFRFFGIFARCFFNFASFLLLLYFTFFNRIRC